MPINLKKHLLISQTDAYGKTTIIKTILYRFYERTTELLIIKHTRLLLSQYRGLRLKSSLRLSPNKEQLKYRETKYSRFAARASGRVNAFRLTTPLSRVLHSYVTSPHMNQGLRLASSLWRAFYNQNPKTTRSSLPLPLREGFVSSKRESHTLSIAVVTWCNLIEKR